MSGNYEILDGKTLALLVTITLHQSQGSNRLEHSPFVQMYGRIISKYNLGGTYFELN
jgi:hypothetical protein